MNFKNYLFLFLYDFDILIDEKSHENILIYDISYNALIGPKPLRIRFEKTDGVIRIYDETTTMVIILWKFLMFDQIFLSPQVKRVHYLT